MYTYNIKHMSTKKKRQYSKHKVTIKNIHNRKLYNVKYIDDNVSVKNKNSKDINITKSIQKPSIKTSDDFFNNTKNKERPHYKNIDNHLKQLYRLNIGSINSDFYILNRNVDAKMNKLPGEILILPLNTSLYKGIQYPKQFIKEKDLYNGISWYGSLKVAHGYSRELPKKIEDYDMLEAKVFSFITKNNINLINITDHRNLDYLLKINKLHNKSPQKEIFIALIYTFINYKIDDNASKFIEDKDTMKTMDNEVQKILKFRNNFVNSFIRNSGKMPNIGYRCNIRENKCYDFLQEHNDGSATRFGSEKKNSLLRNSIYRFDDKLARMVHDLVSKYNLNIHGFFSPITISMFNRMFHPEICLFKSNDVLSYDPLNMFNKTTFFGNKKLTGSHFNKKINKIKKTNYKYYQQNLRELYEDNRKLFLSEFNSIKNKIKK